MLLMELLRRISIHAPRTGSDTERNTQLTALNDFNPRSPHGERPSGSSSPMPNSLFQSTLPARGATKWKYVYTYSEKISIHAPRTGSDTGKNRHETGRIISIHAPRTGSDPAGVRLQYCHAISIHAPRTGSDVLSPLQLASTSYISIHAPRTGSDRASSSVASTM